MGDATPDGEPEFEVPGVVSITWDPDCEAVLVVWQGPGVAADFKALLPAEIAALRRHGASKLLVDCRLQGPLPREDQDWADSEWVPKAIAAGLRRFAVVLPDNREAAINLEDRLGRVKRSELQIAFFERTQAARAWLGAGPHAPPI